MIYSSELDVLDLPDRYFKLCVAYMRSAIRLCRCLVDGTSEVTFANACVVLWTARHATELFYKGCLVSATGEVPRPPEPMRGHNLVFLEYVFRQHFPLDRFTFSPPAGESLVGGGWSEEDVQQFLRDSNSTHERYRYPTDSRGNAFDSPGEVEPACLLDTLVKSEVEMDHIITEVRSSRVKTANQVPTTVNLEPSADIGDKEDVA